MKNHFFIRGALLFLSLTLPNLADDFNNDGLPDFWQQQYGAQNLTPAGDDDNDGYNNETEAIAGTDPFDASDLPQLEVRSFNVTNADTPNETAESNIIEIPINRNGWILSANRNTGELTNAIDGNIGSRWDTEESQRSGQIFGIDFGQTQQFHRILLNSTNSPNDYPRGYTLRGSNDGINFVALATGSGIEGRPTNIVLPSPANYRYIQIEQTGTANFWWSIHEINVYQTVAVLTDSNNLSNFSPFGPQFYGEDAWSSLLLSSNSNSYNAGNVQLQYWANVSGTDIASLAERDTFPYVADGESRLSNLETTPLQGAGFGLRLLTLITPPQTGEYTLFLSSGSSARLYLSSDTSPDNHVLLSQVFPAQTIAPNDFTAFDSQRSTPVTLVAGLNYLLEIHALASHPQSHCQVAWSGPGISGTEIITAEHLAQQNFLTSPRDSNEILNYDYETSATALWPNTEVIAAPDGMTGSAERITMDPGNTVAETLTFSEVINDHFYLRFLAQIGTGHTNISLYANGSGGFSEEGPRIELDLRNSLPHIRAGGSNGTNVFTEINYNETYRIEVVAALHTPFVYSTELTQNTVQPRSFDIYISNSQGNLIAKYTGLPFRDTGDINSPTVVTNLANLRIGNTGDPTNPSNTTITDATFDDWNITAGSIDGEGHLNSNISSIASLDNQHFFRLNVTDTDQDGDGLSDASELLLSRYNPFLFFDAETNNGTSDIIAATNLIQASSQNIEFSLQASDTVAYEDNSPNIGDDHGEFIITRTGALTAITAKLCIAPLKNTGNTATVCDGICCTLIGSAGDEAAEVNDYTLVDEDGNIINDTVHFDFGQLTKTVTVIATTDTQNEYPETLNIALLTDSSYEISDTNGASIQLFDLPESPSNNAIFTGLFSLDGNAVTTSNGSGSTTAILNGPRTKLYITSEFSGLTSNQQDSHIHKSNAGATPAQRVGPIIYAITETPGDETTDPLLGPLDNYVWDITESSGAVSTNGGQASKQVVIDALFAQNGETPLYFNLHTVNNPAGEIWSFLTLTGGSIQDPGDPTPPANPGSSEFPILTGEELEIDVRRFLNQATFGTLEEDVADLMATIENTRQTQPSYHRVEAFEDWIDAQMATPQTYLLDYHLATDFQHIKLRGWFDPLLNPSNAEIQTPPLPNTWPTPDRATNSDPSKWHLNLPYPVNDDHEDLANFNDLGGAPNDNTRRQAFFSTSDSTILNSHYSSSNYQDMLNAHAFSHYRDILGFVNWSPIMGKWLSSLQNQKGLDIDGDGINDISPDENLARENMQLFSIGLFDIWPDGTLRLGSGGSPNNTYTNQDIQEFAKILTGQSFSVIDNQDEGWGGIPFDQIPVNTDFGLSDNSSDLFGAKYLYPMIMFGEFHDRSVKTFAGTTIDNTHINDARAQGIADINDAIDWLAGSPGDGNPDFDGVHSHGSTPAFISRRLIQRLTTSNPSRDSLHRVATTFKETEGNLSETLKTILLDPEARNLDLSNENAGVKKSPLENYIQICRSLSAHSLIPVGPNINQYPFTDDDEQADYSNPDLLITNFGYPSSVAQSLSSNSRMMVGGTLGSGTDSLLMEPFRQETVFNWYLPDFAPSGPVANAGLVAPEMQLANEQDVVRNINYNENIVHFIYGNGGSSLASSSDTQTAIFNGNSNTFRHDNHRVDLELLTSEIYPDSPPTPTTEHTSEFLANLEVLDILDKRLTNGILKARYSIDASDDGIDGANQNPRELIVHSVSFGGDNPWDGNNDAFHRQRRIEDMLYLLVASPDFQVKK